MTSMFQFGSRQDAGADVTSVSRQNTSTSGEVGATYSTRDIGAMLRERREAMGVTLAEAEAATRIRQKYIAALESDEWHLLPGEVVGRGFLRNYSAYLGMEPTDVIERRRSVTDPRLASTLASTSAGSALPPIRQVDYRPKEVELLDEAEGMETREVRFAPFLLVLGALALFAFLWWVREPLVNIGTAAVENVQALMARPEPVATTPEQAPEVIVNPDNVAAAETGSTDGSSTAGGEGTGQQPSDAISAPVLIPTATPTAAPPTPTEVAPAAIAVEPTATPTETPVPLPTATNTPEAVAVAADTPILLPTDAPDNPEPVEPEEELVVAPVCPDQRSLIASPGVAQTVSGIVGVTGSATHEAFQYYKLEYAPGANASGGFVYFDGGNAPVNGGLLGGLDSTILPNGAYTIQLIVVDATGNFPPPCNVSVNVEN